MKQFRYTISFLAVCLCCLLPALTAVAQAQTAATAGVVVQLPHVVNYSGNVPDAEPGMAVTLKFSLYQQQTGGDPVWTESQPVTPDSKGRYAVLLGAATQGGLPQTVFNSAQARWLGVSVADAAELPRIILVATPYSLKASDAETLAGHPVSDFALLQKDADGKPETDVDITDVVAGTGITVTGDGTSTVTVGINSTYLESLAANFAVTNAANTFKASQTIDGALTVTGNINIGGAITSTYLDSLGALYAPLKGNNTFSGINTFSSLVMFASSQTFPNTLSAITASFGITASNSAGNVTVAVNPMALESTFNAQYAQLAAADYFSGANSFAALQTLVATGAATTSSGFDSNALKFAASAYNSTAGGPQSVGYLWQAEPTGNDTASPAATLNLLYQNGTTNPAETGLSVASNGRIAFASGQTFPGTGAGTITGITTSSPLSGSGTSGSVALSLNTSALETTLDSIYPQLSASVNTFAGAAAFTANTTGSAVTGQNNGATGGYGLSGSGFNGVYANGTNQGLVATGGNYGVYSTSPTSIGIYGSGFYGLEAVGNATTGTGVNASGGDYGVNATAMSANGTGVYGIGIQKSAEGQTVDPASIGAIGVWGDTNQQSGPAVMGTADNGVAGAFYSNSPSGFTTIYLQNDDTTGQGYTFLAQNSYNNTSCLIDPVADFRCSGTVQVVHAEGDRKVATYGVQSAENWIEDFGSGQLSSGSAHIALEAKFAAAVNSGVEYHVFLTPQGECEGLYIAAKSDGGFDVRELHHGNSAVSFDYRIVAKRKGYENVRMEDLTDSINRHAELNKRRAAPDTHPANLHQLPHVAAPEVKAAAPIKRAANQIPQR